MKRHEESKPMVRQVSVHTSEHRELIGSARQESLREAVRRGRVKSLTPCILRISIEISSLPPSLPPSLQVYRAYSPADFSLISELDP